MGVLARDHVPQLCVTAHARVRFVERCRWDLRPCMNKRGRERSGMVDVELRRMIAAATWRYGAPSWKVEELGSARRRRLPDSRWIVELIANTLPCDSDGAWRFQRVAMLLVCDCECWTVKTVLTGPPPRIAIDVFEPSA